MCVSCLRLAYETFATTGRATSTSLCPCTCECTPPHISSTIYIPRSSPTYRPAHRSSPSPYPHSPFLSNLLATRPFGTACSFARFPYSKCLRKSTQMFTHPYPRDRICVLHHSHPVMRLLPCIDQHTESHLLTLIFRRHRSTCHVAAHLRACKPSFPQTTRNTHALCCRDLMP